jgi:hypothetical protein
VNIVSNTTQTDHLEKLLQPDILIELGGTVSGPLDLLELKNRVDESRLSQNGDSATSQPTVEYMIQFKPETWETLNRLAERLEARGASVTPAEVATLLVEYSVAQITRDARE